MITASVHQNGHLLVYEAKQGHMYDFLLAQRSEVLAYGGIDHYGIYIGDVVGYNHIVLMSGYLPFNSDLHPYDAKPETAPMMHYFIHQHPPSVAVFGTEQYKNGQYCAYTYKKGKQYITGIKGLYKKPNVPHLQ